MNSGVAVFILTVVGLKSGMIEFGSGFQLVVAKEYVLLRSIKSPFTKRNWDEDYNHQEQDPHQNASRRHKY